MKMNPSFWDIVKKINHYSSQLGGVFTFSDLWNIISLGSSDRIAKVVTRLIKEGILFKIKKNIYITDHPDLWVLASRLREKSYISLDSVLAKNGLIGTLPGQSVSAIHLAPPMTIFTPDGRIRFFKIKKDLFFGIKKEAYGVQVADSEKAYLDLLYYHLKGGKFIIDPISDVDVDKLDKNKIKKYLKFYKNPKFKKFAERQTKCEEKN